jgi:hypothetical protein
MPSASFAEWILARFTTRARATSIIGDLIEAVPQKGKLWFWLSVARVFVSLTWRRPLAVGFAFCVGILWSRTYQFSAYSVISAYRRSPDASAWAALYHYVYLVGMYLSLGWAYTMTVFGLRDFFARYLLAAWMLLAVLVFFGTIRPVTVACCLLAGCGVAYSVTSKSCRKGLLALLISVALNFCWGAFSFVVAGLMGITGRPLSLRQLTSELSGRGVLYVTAPIPMWVIWSYMLAGIFAACFIYARVHRMFFENGSRNIAEVSVEIS